MAQVATDLYACIIRDMHIAWLVEGTESYGTHRMVVSLVGRLVEVGHQVTVIAIGHGHVVEECMQLGAHVVVLGLPSAPAFLGPRIRRVEQVFRQALWARRVWPRLASAASGQRFDAVHVLLQHFVVLASRLAGRDGVPCLWQMPNDVRNDYPIAVNRWVYQAQCVVGGVTPLGISRHNASTLRGPLVSPLIHYLGADERTFNPDEVAPAVFEDIDPGQICFGIFARIAPDKGHAQFVSALSRVATRQLPLQLLCVGSEVGGTDYIEEVMMAAEGNSSLRVFFAGHQSAPEGFYPLVNVAVNARLTPEPYGLSIVEAMLMRIPVLAHGLGGPTETVVDGITGWLSLEGTVDAYESTIRRALADQGSWRSMGELARQRALSRFSLRTHVAQYVTMLQLLGVEV